MMYRCKICSEHYLSTEALQDHQFASHTQEALEAFGITKQTVKVSQDWQTRSNESKTEILHSLGYTPSDIQTLISLEFYQFGSKVKKEIGEVLHKSTPIKQRVQAVESDENKTYQNMYDSYLKSRSAQIKKPFQDGTESKANEAPHTIAEPDSTPQGDNYPTYYFEMSSYPYMCRKCGETVGSGMGGYIQSMIDHLTEWHGITELSVEQTWNESKASEYNNPNIEWTGDDYHTSEWSCKICGETGDNLNFGATISNIEDHLKTHGIGEAKANEGLVYARIFNFEAEIQLVAEGKSKELTEEEALRIKNQYNMKTIYATATSNRGYSGYVDESEFGIGEAKASEEASEDCPKCGHGKNTHSSPASGDTICYGSSDCTCAMTFPTEGESKSNEKEELLSDIIAKINKKYGGDEEQEEEGESVTNDYIITQSDGQRMFECPVCGIYVNLDKSTTYDTLKLHLSGSHNVMKWTDEDMKSLSGESKASEADWDHLTAEDEVELDRNIETLKTAFYKALEEEDSVNSTRILGELERLREIKTTRFGNESKASEKTGYRKRPTGYGTYVYEEKSKINCQNCGKEIYETDGDTFHTTKCRYCGHVNLTNDLTYESKSTEAISEDEKDEIFQYLFDLQESGATNMFGSGAYVERDFPHLDKKVIDDVIQEWMSNWDSIAKRMGIESTSVIIGEALKTHTDYHKLINSTLSGETSIECSKCAKKFKAQENLDIHYNDSHADSEIKSLIGELKANEDDLEERKYLEGVIEDWAMKDLDDEIKQGEAKIGDWDDDRINISVMGDNGEFKDVKELQKEDGEAMVEDIVHKTDSGVDITHPQDEWCELCDEPTTSFEVSDDDYDEKVEDLMEEEGVDEITDFDEEEKKDFFEDVDDIKVTDEEQTEDGEAVGLSNNWDDDEKRMDGDTPQVEDNPYPTYTGDARDQMQNDIKDLSNPNDITTDIKGKPWQDGLESLTEEQELQQARESLAPLNKLDDEKSNVTKAFESGASVEDIYSKVGDTTQDRGSEDDLTDIYNKVDVKLNLEKV